MFKTPFSTTKIGKKDFAKDQLHAIIDMIKRYIGIPELSEYLGIRVSTVYAWVFQKRIPHMKLGKLVKFDLIELEAWLKDKRIEPIKDSLHGSN